MQAHWEELGEEFDQVETVIEYEESSSGSDSSSEEVEEDEGSEVKLMVDGLESAEFAEPQPKQSRGLKLEAPSPIKDLTMIGAHDDSMRNFLLGQSPNAPASDMADSAHRREKLRKMMKNRARRRQAKN